MKHLLILAALVFTLLGTGLGSDAAMAADHQNHTLEHSDRQLPGIATHDFIKALNAMHEPMARGVMDPDPDIAFARGMLWHHRGAVDMALVELKYGKDPELKKLAEAIIKAQEPEITLMQNWLQKRSLHE